MLGYGAIFCVNGVDPEGRCADGCVRPVRDPDAARSVLVAALLGDLIVLNTWC